MGDFGSDPIDVQSATFFRKLTFGPEPDFAGFFGDLFGEPVAGMVKIAGQQDTVRSGLSQVRSDTLE